MLTKQLSKQNTLHITFLESLEELGVVLSYSMVAIRDDNGVKAAIIKDLCDD